MELPKTVFPTMTKNYLDQNFKKLGFGLMRSPFISEKGDIEQMKKMVDLYTEKGFTYFDTSYIYGQGISETNARSVIVERHPRSSFRFATKLPNIEYAKRRYGNIIQESGRASSCIACGSCEGHCPQKLKIITYLQEAVTILEDNKEVTK
ncbi:MAG: aldo/keto reductase [Treponema sp.]|jgi:predicted aldo/keto reductase-like oxidoreductase|nr:aldo/keto reductase [Treponema sp.]